MSSLGRVSYPSIEIDGDHGSAGIRAMRTKNTLVALTLLLAASRVSLAAENPLMGTWKLNESKSKCTRLVQPRIPGSLTLRRKAT